MRERSMWMNPGPALAADSVTGLAGQGLDRWPILGALAMHHDGRVRERALRLLLDGPDDEVTRFVLLRSDDWVPQVRNVAIEATRERMSAERGGSILEAAPVMWSQIMSTESSGRASSVLAEVRPWLLSEPMRDVVWQGLRSSDAYVVRISVTLLRGLEEPLAVHRAVGATSDLLVAAWTALDCLNDGASARAVIDDLLVNRFSFVREHAAFWALRNLPERREELLAVLMIDRSRAVRFQAQYLLRCDGVDAADWYRSHSDRGALALQGLSDVADRRDMDVARSAIADGTSDARRAAGARLLARIDDVEAASLLVAAVGDASPRVSRTAARGLEHRTLTVEMVDDLIAAAAGDRPLHVARNARRALTSLPRWPRLIAALRLATLASGSARPEGLALLDRVVTGWERSATAPSAAHVAEVEALLVVARDDTRLVSSVEPLLRTCPRVRDEESESRRLIWWQHRRATRGSIATNGVEFQV